MKHVIIDNQEEAVKRFVLALAIGTEGSVLEMEGRAIAQLVPLPPARNGHSPTDAEWTDAKNKRRCALIDTKINAALTADEAIELADLQRQMLRYRDRVAPLPLEYARQLHQELLNRLKATPTGQGV